MTIETKFDIGEDIYYVASNCKMVHATVIKIEISYTGKWNQTFYHTDTGDKVSPDCGYKTLPDLKDAILATEKA